MREQRIQCNPSVPDTLGTAQSVLISGVVLYAILCSWDHGWWCPD